MGIPYNFYWTLQAIVKVNVLSCPLVLILSLVVYLYFTKNDNYWKDRGVPYEKPTFLAGSLLDVFKGKRQIGRHLGFLYRKYDTKYFGIFIFGKPYLVIRDPDIIKNITVKDFHNFDNRTFACDTKADDMAGNSLFVLKNPQWRNVRNKLTPIFTSGKMKGMLPFIQESAQDLEKYLEVHDNKILEWKEVSGKFLTDVVASCFFGFRANSFLSGEASKFRKQCHDLFELDYFASFSLFSYFFLPKLVSIFKLKMFDTTYLKALFSEAVFKREFTKTRRNDLIDLLLDARNEFCQQNKDNILTPTVMVSQSITFLMAGFETTSNLVAFCLYELCLRPDFQSKLRNEILESFPKDKKAMIVNFEKVQQLKYLDMVLSETLRRYPFGPFLNRECREDYVIPQTGLKIDKGTPILIPLDGLHFDEKYYTEPEKFYPDRFADGTKSFYNSCVYLPFGIGPRNCIGDRFGLICAKIGLINILRNFKVERCKETPVPLELNPRSPFMTPIDGLKMMVKKL